MILPIINLCLSGIALVGALYCFYSWRVTYNKMMNIIKLQRFIIDTQQKLYKLGENMPFEDYKDEKTD